MKTMTSKYPGVCRDCGARVLRGDTIGYHGRGAGISCAKCAGETKPSREDYECSDMGYEDRCAEACGPGL